MRRTLSAPVLTPVRLGKCLQRGRCFGNAVDIYLFRFSAVFTCVKNEAGWFQSLNL